MNRKKDIMQTLSQNKVGIFMLITYNILILIYLYIIYLYTYNILIISRKRALHNEKGANSPRRNGNSQCVYAWQQKAKICMYMSVYLRIPLESIRIKRYKNRHCILSHMQVNIYV